MGDDDMKHDADMSLLSTEMISAWYWTSWMGNGMRDGAVNRGWLSSCGDWYLMVSQRHLYCMIDVDKHEQDCQSSYSNYIAYDIREREHTVLTQGTRCSVLPSILSSSLLQLEAREQ